MDALSDPDAMSIAEVRPDLDRTFQVSPLLDPATVEVAGKVLLSSQSSVQYLDKSSSKRRSGRRTRSSCSLTLEDGSVIELLRTPGSPDPGPVVRSWTQRPVAPYPRRRECRASTVPAAAYSAHAINR